MADTLDFKTYALAQDEPGEYRPLGASCVRRAEDWLRLFEVAQEMVSLYDLDGSKIPLGAKVIQAEKADVYGNLKRGLYKGIDGPCGTFRGPVENKPYFAVTRKSYRDDSEETTMWFYRPCWWRFLIILP